MVLTEWGISFLECLRDKHLVGEDIEMKRSHKPWYISLMLLKYGAEKGHNHERAHLDH